MNTIKRQGLSELEIDRYSYRYIDILFTKLLLRYENKLILKVKHGKDIPGKHSPKESRYSYANINEDSRKTVAGHNGWCQPKANLGFIQHVVAACLPWGKEGQLSEAGISASG